MRVRYSDILNPSAVNQLKGFPMPEPPSPREMAQELAGLDKLIRHTNLFRSSPMFDSVEIVQTHEHCCIICGDPFACSRPDCGIEDQYAVCLKPACIAEWEKEPVL